MIIPAFGIVSRNVVVNAESGSIYFLIGLAFCFECNILLECTVGHFVFVIIYVGVGLVVFRRVYKDNHRMKIFLYYIFFNLTIHFIWMIWMYWMGLDGSCFVVNNNNGILCADNPGGSLNVDFSGNAGSGEIRLTTKLPVHAFTTIGMAAAAAKVAASVKAPGLSGAILKTGVFGATIMTGLGATAASRQYQQAVENTVSMSSSTSRSSSNSLVSGNNSAGNGGISFFDFVPEWLSTKVLSFYPDSGFSNDLGAYTLQCVLHDLAAYYLALIFLGMMLSICIAWIYIGLSSVIEQTTWAFMKKLITPAMARAGFTVSKMMMVYIMYLMITIVYGAYCNPISAECGEICHKALSSGMVVDPVIIYNLKLFNVSIPLPALQFLAIIVFIPYFTFYSSASKMVDAQPKVMVKMFVMMFPFMFLLPGLSFIGQILLDMPQDMSSEGYTWLFMMHNKITAIIIVYSVIQFITWITIIVIDYNYTSLVNYFSYNQVTVLLNVFRNLFMVAFSSYSNVFYF